MKRIISFATIATLLALVLSCKQDDLSINPNAAGASSTVPVTLILNRITNEMYNGGGVIDGVAGNVNEGPWGRLSKYNQYFVANYPYYWGDNAYTWSNTATQYGMLKYVKLMEDQIKKQYGTTANPYIALAKFYRAYSFIWLSQRVGDIPMTQAGDGVNYPNPTYDTQKDVYKYSLALLDTANSLIAPLAAGTPNTVVSSSGDIFGLTYLQWQKVINSYKLRVLISLSKRADDNADLNIKQQFNNIVTNPTTYPIMTSNADNLAYKYNSAYNQYPAFLNKPYNVYANVGKTYLDITTKNLDPRTFVIATPAPYQIAPVNVDTTKTGLAKPISDFTAYVGANTSVNTSSLQTLSTRGKYSFNNFNRYFNLIDGSAAEAYIIIGYPELCFNIAEGANLGWAPSQSATTWYGKGIDASLAIYGIAQGGAITVIDNTGKSLGTVTADIAAFKAKATYAGDNATGRTQILEQKYVAMFQSSGFEPYYNWRRTGVPAFYQGGVGIGTNGNKIPFRWNYPNDEKIANNANLTSALSNQYGGNDDVFGLMWLIK